MKLFFVFFVFFYFFFMSFSWALNMKSREYKNGLKVYVIEKFDSQKVALHLAYDVGSYRENKGEKGMAHLFEHMMFRGSSAYPDGFHMRRIQEMGGQSNAYTSNDLTVYTQSFPAENLKEVLAMEADRMQNLIFDQSRLNKERQVVLEEYRWRIENSPDGKLFYQARQKLFANHPYQFGPIGKLDDIKNFSLEGLKSFYKRYYSPRYAHLFVVGAVAAGDVFEVVDDLFSAIPAAPKLPDINLNTAPEFIDTTIEIPSPYEEPSILWTLYLPPAQHEDYWPMQLIFRIIAGDDSALLQHTLTRQNTYATRFSAYPYFCKGRGLFYFMAFFKEEDREILNQTFYDVIESIRLNGFNETELLKAKKQIKAEKVFSSYAVDQIISDFAYETLIRQRPNDYFTVIDQIESVDLNTLHKVYKRYFRSDNWLQINFTHPK